MRLIDADKAIDNINEWLDTVGCVVIGKGLSYYAELIGCIDESPTVEAEPVKHGHWIDVNGNSSLYECSFCGEQCCCEGNYCSNCGAKMEDNKCG